MACWTWRRSGRVGDHAGGSAHGALVFVLAQQYGIYTQRATAAILASTILSVATLSALFAMLGVE